MNKKLFLSAVSSEFEEYRKLLTGDLKRPTLDVAVQEDFGVIEGTTLQKLDKYICACDGMVHLIGKAVGAIPEVPAVKALLEKYPDLPDKLPPLAEALAQPDPGFSYTQWEAYLAIYHERPLFVYRPTDFDLAVCECPREDRFEQDAAEEQAQRDHCQRICDLGHDRGQFLNPERLSSTVLRDLVGILPALEKRIEVPPTRLTHTAEVLVGRDEELTVLDDAWNNAHTNLVVVRGKGGEGKTSLVATWMAELAFKDWRGAERVIDWSFYSQGTRDQTAATAEFFVNQTLIDLGDPDPNAGSPLERATRLVSLINEKKTLLVLDGLEPLQYPPGPLQGALKDAGMATLLRGLVAQNAGLVVVTTREKVTEIQQHYGRSAIDHDLTELSPLAGARLLFNAGARRVGAVVIKPDDKELQKASSEVRGHALTLFLVGQYLRLTEQGDIRKRDTIDLAEAEREYSNDATRPYGHAFKAIEAYERWFESGDEKTRLQRSVLQMLGLFDRPASPASLAAIKASGIEGLTDLWKKQSDSEWRMALARLTETNLIELSDKGAVDSHPLIREYFAEQMRTKMPQAFQTAHSILFDFLCESTEHQPSTLADLQPLYEAVTHGCLAGRHQEACEKVYVDRILRGTGHDGFYSTNKLGAIGSDLAAVAAFFDEPWIRLSPSLNTAVQNWLLNEAAFRLRALGRLTEALQPMRSGSEIAIQQKNWKNAARLAGNLSELELTLGHLPDAVDNARRSITYADKSGETFQRIVYRTTAADALHQSGQRAEAGALFVEAERMQQESQPQFDQLYSVQGFQYCEWLLAPAEQSARRRLLHKSLVISNPWVSDDLDEVERRAATTLSWVKENQSSLLDIALDNLTLARVQLIRSILAEPIPQPTLNLPHIATALNGLRAAGLMNHLPRGLLTAALYHFVRGEYDLAEVHLTEAQQISELGPMPLFLADIHLTRARFARSADGETGVWRINAKAELETATFIIRTHGYVRRNQELTEFDDVSASNPLSTRQLDIQIKAKKQSQQISAAIPLFLERARLHNKLKDYELARWDYKKYLSLCRQESISRDHQALLELAQVEYRSGLFTDALNHIKELIEHSVLKIPEKQMTQLKIFRDQLQKLIGEEE